MPNDSPLHSFYTSKTWRDLSYHLKLIRGGKCARTGKIFSDFSQLIAHHSPIELTVENMTDPQIALNPDNIEIVSFLEHNKEHRRFGYKQQVYIVYGSPLSGKTTMVRDMMRHGDIVLDIGALWEAVTFLPESVKPKNCRFNVFTLRDNLLEQIKMRHGQWYSAYVVGGYPDKYERDRLAQTLGAELIYCESTKEECIARIAGSGKPDSWVEYVDDWWEKYTPPAS